MAEAVTKKTKIIFIANPDNPTGTYLNHKQVGVFLSKIPKNILLFFDEAYFEFAPGDFPQTKKFLKNRGNIIFSRTFSKIYGLAGLRLGYAITSVEIAEGLDKIREPFNINRFAQVAALAGIKDKSFIKKVLPYIKKEKEYFYREMDKLGLVYVKSATNFIFVNFKQDTLKLNDYLLKNGVIIRELTGWGLKNCFRVTVGLRKENKKFIGCLKNYLKQ
jgi:histidinol-phosphate aminotransferase